MIYAWSFESGAEAFDILIVTIKYFRWFKAKRLPSLPTPTKHRK
jgi:hypothetical protein